MIIQKSLPYLKIKSQLKKSDKIGIISCDSCARLCNAGGEKIMNQMANKFKKDGFEVVDIDLIGNPCNYDLLNKSQLHGNVQIVMACDAGVYNLKKLFPKHKIIAANKTIGLGVHDKGRNLKVIKKFR